MATTLQPSHRKKHFEAARKFTDREPSRDVFLQALEWQQEPHQYKVLMFYGVGGEGKSALRREFERILEERSKADDHLGWATLDFEFGPHRVPEEALVSLRLALRKTANVSFPAFDAAYTQHFAQTYPGADLRARRPELFGPGCEFVQDLVELLASMTNVSTLGILPLFTKPGIRLTHRLRDWWYRRGRDVLEGIEKYRGDELLQRLPVYFGADLCEAVFGPDGDRPAKKRLVVLLDTYEALWRDRGIKSGRGAGRADVWVRRMVQESPGTLFVIFGRDWADVERWEEETPDWANYTEPHRLGALSANDADAFLSAVPVTEQDIREAMVSSSAGIPFCLDLQVDLYEKLKNQEESLSAEVFGHTPDAVIDRFLEHLTDTERNLLRVLAHGRWFDESLFCYLGEKFFGGAAAAPLKAIVGHSFVESPIEGVYALHGLMRDHLVAMLRSEEPSWSQRIHEELFAWHDERAKVETVSDITPEKESALEEAAYHLRICAPRKFPMWCWDRDALYHQGACYELVAELREWAVSVGLEYFGEEDPITLNNMGNLAATLRSLGDLAAARDLEERLVEVRLMLQGEEHPATLAAMSNFAATLRNLDELCEAQELEERVLEVRRKLLGEEHLDTLASKSSLALTYRNRGDLPKAQEFEEEVLKGDCRTYGEHHPATLESMRRLASVLWELGDLVRARGLEEQVLETRLRSLGEGHPETLRSMVELAATLKAGGDWEGAVKLEKQVAQVRGNLVDSDRARLLQE